MPSYSMIVEISRSQNFSSILHCSARDVNCVDALCVSEKGKKHFCLTVVFTNSTLTSCRKRKI